MLVCGEAAEARLGSESVGGGVRYEMFEVPSQCREGVVEGRVASRSPALGQSDQTHAPLAASSNLTQESPSLSSLP